MGKSCKVVVCGQASVGKTSILEQLLYGNHVVGSEMIETQEDIYVGSIETDRGVREQVRFYDTRGLRDGLELPKHCFSCTDGYVLVYSTDSKESFKRVELLKKEIDKSKDKKEVTIVVLGNKCDLQEQRRVDHDAAQHWAKGTALVAAQPLRMLEVLQESQDLRSDAPLLCGRRLADWRVLRC
ncbi:NF-kappa-B inhibitor-interacting Ras-like protein 2 isoform X1 [Gavia stellata]|uniref:NF-kappa-B inhibitor-interacting Ras-like protein 2 isoform X1 n=1 Tax=Gavia stellata TaxID=37040 RepID=UPI002899F98C|nr:NF-kappa-B inhibitor-interacting Ras-like protein 2 isoform X1 [Gavia stellata]